jgi:hypothetical protein
VWRRGAAFSKSTNNRIARRRLTATTMMKRLPPTRMMRHHNGLLLRPPRCRSSSPNPHGDGATSDSSGPGAVVALPPPLDRRLVSRQLDRSVSRGTIATRCLVSFPSAASAKVTLLHKLVGKRSRPFDDDTSSTISIKENEPRHDSREATGRSRGNRRPGSSFVLNGIGCPALDCLIEWSGC